MEIARIPGSKSFDGDLVTLDMPDATPGKPMATLVFYETPLGTTAIEGLTVGKYDENIQQHRLLNIVMNDILPYVVAAAQMHTEQTHESTETAQ